MKELIIRVKWGGLGDHLFYTNVPRLAKEQGYDKVFISNLSEYKSPLIRAFVWELNPYVDGFINEDIPNWEYPCFEVVPEEGLSVIDAIVIKWFGLKDDGIRFREPEVYYKPKLIPELKDSVIFDPNFGTAVGHPSIDAIKKYLKLNNIKVDYQMSEVSGFNNRSLPDVLKMKTSDLETFSDILFSCKQIICFNTGTAPLAAALGKSAIVLHTGRGLWMFRHSKLHNYVELKCK